jgi:hypothetical protein
MTSLQVVINDRLTFQTEAIIHIKNPSISFIQWYWHLQTLSRYFRETAASHASHPTAFFIIADAFFDTGSSPVMFFLFIRMNAHIACAYHYTVPLPMVWNGAAHFNNLFLNIVKAKKKRSIN